MIPGDLAYKRLNELLDTQTVGVLATVWEGRPYAHLVAFAVAPNRAWLFFAAPRRTRKFSNTMESPTATLLLDNRHAPGIGAAAAVAIEGLLRESRLDELSLFFACYLARHPGLKDYASAPETTRMVLEVEKYVVVTGATDVSVIRPIAGRGRPSRG